MFKITLHIMLGQENQRFKAKIMKTLLIAILILSTANDFNGCQVRAVNDDLIVESRFE